MNKLRIALVAGALVVIGLLGTAGIASADAHQGNPGTDFVCPVIGNDAVGAHNPIAGPLGVAGYYTVVPATSQTNQLNVPDQATNGNGAGNPGGPFAAPGDTDYTAIWNGN